MRYKGYIGRVEVDAEAGLLHGEVAGLRDVVTFQGRTVPEAVEAFRASVDDYLAYCASLRRAPEKPYSGKILLRVKPALHRELAVAAGSRKVSLNALAERVLTKALRQRAARAARGSVEGAAVSFEVQPKRAAAAVRKARRPRAAKA